MLNNLKVALVQDWLTELGGAEKVFSTLMALFPEADVFSLTSHPSVINKLGINPDKHKDSFIAALPFGRTKYRNYLPLFPKAIESFDLSEYDLVISSSYAVAKGVLTNNNQLQICYCHSPMRYAWDLHHQYLHETNLNGLGFKSWYVQHILHKLRIWDVVSANRVDHFIANSNYIKKRIQKVYRRDAEVIFPPVDTERFVLKEDKEDFYFTASRLVPYKKIDLIVKAFSQIPDKKLMVAGTGPDFHKIKASVTKTSNIKMLGFISDEEMISYMQKAKAFVFAADEDFGIIPVEAQACGTPVIALGRGGTKETVIDGKTGVHFYEQTEKALIGAIQKFENNMDSFDPKIIRQNAERFSKKRFSKELEEFVSIKMNLFQNNR